MYYKSFAFTTVITGSNNNQPNSKWQLRSEYS